MLMLRFFVIVVCLCFTSTVSARLRVLACEPEWAALATAIGGEKVNVFSATSHTQDPHFIQARPALIAKARRADVLICSGAGLEAGWLPILLRKSGGQKIRPGSPGYVMAAEQMELLQKPVMLDRSQGDVHAAGNPHIHLNPRRMLAIAALLRDRLSLIEPAAANTFNRNFSEFESAIQMMLEDRAEQIAALKGVKIVVHHNSWIYLAEWLLLEQLATIEPKPGIPPSSSFLSSLVHKLEQTPVDYIVHSNYQNQRASRWLSGRIDAPIRVIQYSPMNWQEGDALIKWYQSILDALAAENRDERQ